MAIALPKNELKVKLCEAIGLDPDRTQSILIRIEPDRPVTVEAVVMADYDEVLALCDVMNKQFVEVTSGKAAEVA